MGRAGGHGGGAALAELGWWPTGTTRHHPLLGGLVWGLSVPASVCWIGL